MLAVCSIMHIECSMSQGWLNGHAGINRSLTHQRHVVASHRADGVLPVGVPSRLPRQYVHAAPQQQHLRLAAAETNQCWPHQRLPGRGCKQGALACMLHAPCMLPGLALRGKPQQTRPIRTPSSSSPGCRQPPGSCQVPPRPIGTAGRAGRGRQEPTQEPLSVT